MKKTILFLLFSMTLFAQAPTPAQYGLKTPTLFPWSGTNKINMNGRFKLNTSAGGFIPAQMTTTQRLAVGSPEVGESVYDVTLGKYYHWSGMEWVESGGGSPSASDLEATLAAGNVANNNITLYGPTGTQLSNYAGGSFVIQDTAPGLISSIGASTEIGGTSNLYFNYQETGVNAKTNMATIGLASEYFSINGTKTVNFKVPWKATSGTYTLVTSDDIPATALPEHQVAVGQIGDVIGSSPLLTFEGGTLTIDGNDALTVANGQPLDSDLTSISSLSTTTFGRSGLIDVDAAAARTRIGAGTSNFNGVYSSLSGIPSTFTPSAHNQAWSTITSTPTTLSGYGITDAYPLTGNPSGFLTANQSITLSGDITGSGATSISTTIGTGAVTSGKILDGTIANADINSGAAIDATKLGAGSVDNTELGRLDGVTSSVQTQINSFLPVTGQTFLGPVALNNLGGTYYNSSTQTGAITFSVSASTIGGFAELIITANGSAITPVGSWINIGSDSISTTSGAVNRIGIWVVQGEVWYSVKVN